MERRSTLPELLLPPVCVCVSCVFVCVSFLDLAPFLEQPADILVLHPPQVVALDQMARGPLVFDAAKPRYTTALSA